MGHGSVVDDIIDQWQHLQALLLVRGTQLVKQFHLWGGPLPTYSGRAMMVTTGDTSIAIVKLRSPIKAKSIAAAEG